MVNLRKPLLKGRATITIKDEFRNRTIVTNIGYSSDNNSQYLADRIGNSFKSMDEKLKFIVMDEKTWKDWIKSKKILKGITERKMLNLAKKYFEFSFGEEQKLKRWISEVCSSIKIPSIDDLLSEGYNVHRVEKV